MNKVSPESKELRRHLLRLRRENNRRNIFQMARGTSKSVLTVVDTETYLLAESFLKRIENGEPLTMDMWKMARLELESRIWDVFYQKHF